MSGFKVLVVDDSPVYRKLVEHALSQDASAVLFATSGDQALEIFELAHSEIVIADWLNPTSRASSFANASVKGPKLRIPTS